MWVQFQKLNSHEKLIQNAYNYVLILKITKTRTLSQSPESRALLKDQGVGVDQSFCKEHCQNQEHSRVTECQTLNEEGYTCCSVIPMLKYQGKELKNLVMID
jgi:hypothetical protein